MIKEIEYHYGEYQLDEAKALLDAVFHHKSLFGNSHPSVSLTLVSQSLVAAFN
jgi:hypothetical protein